MPLPDLRIPRHWSKATGTLDGRTGRGPLVAWGWSDTSQAEAQALARQRLERIANRIRNGLPLPRAGYLYEDRPLREEILEELRGPTGAVDSLLTRNSYGSVVLNTPSALFVDVDLPRPPKRGFLDRLLRRPVPTTDDGAELAKLRNVLRGLGGSYRVYRTAAGWRVLATDRLFDPTSSEARDAMVAMDSDPAYRKLCRAQQSFRARLSPKPWRCAVGRPPGRFPRETSDAKKFARWLEKYESAIASNATCRFVETIGPGRVIDDLEPILEVHDARSRALESLPLA